MSEDPHPGLVQERTSICTYRGVNGEPSDPLVWPSKPLFDLGTFPTESGTHDAGKSSWETTAQHQGIAAQVRSRTPLPPGPQVSK